MLVKCKACANKVDRNEAFKVVINGKNNYYCNENEYLKLKVEKESRKNVLSLCEEILGKTTNTILMKDLKEIADIHTYLKVSQYLQANIIMLSKSIAKVNYNEFSRIRYLMAIIKNEIADFKIIKLEEEFSNIEVIENYNYQNIRRKTFLDYINEY